MIKSILGEAAALHELISKDQTLHSQIQTIADECIKALNNDRKIIFCGNGGSFSDAQHITAEFVGRFLKDRHALPAICLGCNLSSTTAITNDYSFDEVFARELSAIGQPGDVLIGISTSGNSRNVLTAINEAKKNNIHVFGLTSNKGGLITKECPCIEIPSASTPRVQECHILVGHIICQLVDDALAS